MWALQGSKADNYNDVGGVLHCWGDDSAVRGGLRSTRVQLSVSDMAVDDASNPTLVQLHIKQSKTNLVGLGTKLVVGRTGTSLCPLLDYLQLREVSEGPLFRCG